MPSYNLLRRPLLQSFPYLLTQYSTSLPLDLALVDLHSGGFALLMSTGSSGTNIARCEDMILSIAVEKISGLLRLPFLVGHGAERGRSEWLSSDLESSLEFVGLPGESQGYSSTLLRLFFTSVVDDLMSSCPVLSQTFPATNCRGLAPTVPLREVSHACHS